VHAKQVKIRSFALPGMVMKSTCDLVHDGSGFSITRNSIHIDGKLIADAELTMMLMDFPSPELPVLVRERARRHGVEMGMMS
ncbi:MAG: beta-hydroxyacyl-ACP dehydratase, partial [Bauldia litoralis]